MTILHIPCIKQLFLPLPNLTNLKTYQHDSLWKKCVKKNNSARMEIFYLMIFENSVFISLGDECLGRFCNCSSAAGGYRRSKSCVSSRINGWILKPTKSVFHHATCFLHCDTKMYCALQSSRQWVLNAWAARESVRRLPWLQYQW